jgi:hypothetical protein
VNEQLPAEFDESTGEKVSWRQQLGWAAWAVTAAFGTYFCMYAFRRPFTAARYEHVLAFGLSMKTVLVSAQVAGYMLSKFMGIRVVSELPASRRAAAIVFLIAGAEFSLLLFGLTPPPWNAFWLFCNGLPLGMVFGLVLGFLEGRRLSEALTAGLCASFILADGVTKSVGAWLLGLGISEQWMPAAAGALFFPLLLVFVAMLARIPPPNHQDVAERSVRVPMTREQRWSLFWRYAPGLSALVTAYVVITILRSVRGDFAPEIWLGLGYVAQPSTFTWSEMIVAFGVLIVNGSLIFARDSRTAFSLSLAVCAAGVLLMALALGGLHFRLLSPMVFMVAIGLGLYLPYVAMHTSVFERLLAMTREHANIGFLMYLADSTGYLGYASVMIARNVWRGDGHFLEFFVQVCWSAIGVSGIAFLLSWRYFLAKCPKGSREASQGATK